MLYITYCFDGCGRDSYIMEEEIFGPILPVLTYEKIDDVIEYINSKPAPLVLYVFSRTGNFTDM